MASEIYARFVDLISLLPEDRADLKAKRGFADATIDAARLRSGQPSNAAYIREVLAKEFPASALAEAGLLVPDESGREVLVPNPKLCAPNILIPFLDGSRVVHLRPHKDGLAGIEAQFYRAATAEQVVLAESEFKALAAAQLGYGAWGIPGISSFSRRHLPRLVEALRSAGVKRVVVVFDNEVKDDPALPNYKPDPINRWDTPFYSIVMAQGLEAAGLEAAIGTLPDSWRRDGKADIDGALAAGKGRADLEPVIRAALPWRAYLKNLPAEAAPVVKRKLLRWHHSSAVQIKGGHYIATRRVGKEDLEVAISNFVLRLRNNFHTVDPDSGETQIDRQVVFQGEDGSTSAPFTLDADAMASPDAFRRYALSKGDYKWVGTLSELMEIWESEFLRGSGRVVYQPDHVGQQDGKTFALFSNAAIDHEGKVLLPDDDGIVWVGEEGFRTKSLDMQGGGVPVLDREGSIDVEAVAYRMAESFGTEAVKLAIGWLVASFFADEVADRHGVFPLLGIFGKRRSGKTTLAEWIMAMAGREGEISTISETTQVFVSRNLAYLSNLPLCLDEYRNTTEIQKKDGFLRSIYNRQTAGKGLKVWGVRTVRLRGTLVLAGEDRPVDNALITRLVEVNLSERARTGRHYDWLRAQVPAMAAFPRQILERRSAILPRLLAAVEAVRKKLASRPDMDVRTALNYAVAASGYSILVEKPDLAFRDWFVREAGQIAKDREDGHVLNRFWEDVQRLILRGEADDEWVRLDTASGGKGPHFGVVYLNGLYEAWAVSRRRQGFEENLSLEALRRYMTGDGYLFENGVSRRIKGKAVRCAILDLRNAPQYVLDLFPCDAASQDMPKVGASA